MDLDTLFYALHWLFVLAALRYSWALTQGQLLHPHFMFTFMICVFLSDFLVRGFDDERIIPFHDRVDIYRYQGMILTIFTIIVIVTGIPKLATSDRVMDQIKVGMQEVKGIRTAIYALVTTLLFVELVKRLSSVDWSFSEMILMSLQARGTRIWDLASMSGNFIFALSQIFLPLGGVSAAYLTAGARGFGLALSFALLTIIATILVTDGSRTPVAITFVTLGLFWAFKYQTIRARLVPISLAAVAMMLAFSLMYLNRSTGYNQIQNSTRDNQEFAVTYAQDDSYYRAIYAYAYSDQTGKSWSATEFFFTIAVNPIPRAFWPGKPLVDAGFYDGFKLDYVTNLFLGEIVAMTGPTLSLIFSPLAGIGIYLFLFSAYKLLRYPLGFVAYLLVALYTYQCMRSLPNLTHFCYLPALAVLASWWLQRRKQRELAVAAFRTNLAMRRGARA